MSKLEEKFKPHIYSNIVGLDKKLIENTIKQLVEITEQERIGFAIGFKQYLEQKPYQYFFDDKMQRKTDEQLIIEFQLYQKSKENE